MGSTVTTKVKAKNMTLLTEQQLEIRAMARDVAEGELRPGAEGWDAAGALPDSVLETLRELGFFGLEAPESLGGLELDRVSTLLALESLAWGDASVALSLAVHASTVTRALLRYGTPDQQARWLAPMAEGTVLAGAPVAGGAGAATFDGSLEAHPDGDGWRLTGSVPWVLNGGRAGVVLVFAALAGTRTPVPLLLDLGRVDVARHPSPRTLGFTAADLVTLTLNGVRVEADARLGGDADGASIAREVAATGQAAMAAIAIGVGQAALDYTVRYATERVQFGRALAEFGGVEEKLAGALIELAQARAFLLGAVARLEAEVEPDDVYPLPHVSTLAMAKVAASAAALRAADEAVQIHGGYGYMRDYPVERRMRDAKGTELFEGTNEQLRARIAQDLISTSSTVRI